MKALSPAEPCKQRFPFLDVFRGAAIVAVLLYHAALEVSEATLRFSNGFWDATAFDPARSVLQLLLQWISVPTLFFLVSGFVVHYARLGKAGAPIGPFLLRRLLRLYVPYAAVLVFFAFLFPPTQMWPTSFSSAIHLVTHIVPVFNLNDLTLWSINPSFWYVATELQLCLLYPLVLLGVRRLGWPMTLAALALVQVGTQLGSTLHDLWDPTKPATTLGDNWAARCAVSYCFSWGLGAFAAEQLRSGKLTRPRTASLVLLPLLSLAMALFQVSSVLAMTAVAVWGWGLLRLMLWRRHNAPAAEAPAWRRRLAAPLVALCQISLAVYLLNQPLMHTLYEPLLALGVSPFSRLMLTVLLTTLMTVPLAWAFTRYIETPLTRWAMSRSDAWLARFEGEPAIRSTLQR